MRNWISRCSFGAHGLWHCGVLDVFSETQALNTLQKVQPWRDSLRLRFWFSDFFQWQCSDESLFRHLLSRRRQEGISATFANAVPEKRFDVGATQHSGHASDAREHTHGHYFGRVRAHQVHLQVCDESGDERWVLRRADWKDQGEAFEHARYSLFVWVIELPSPCEQKCFKERVWFDHFAVGDQEMLVDDSEHLTQSLIENDFFRS